MDAVRGVLALAEVASRERHISAVDDRDEKERKSSILPESQTEVQTDGDEDEMEAVNILTSVLNTRPRSQSLCLDDIDSRPVSGLAKRRFLEEGDSPLSGTSSPWSTSSSPTGSASLLLDLASIASRRAPVEPIRRSVSRLSLADNNEATEDEMGIEGDDDDEEEDGGNDVDDDDDEEVGMLLASYRRPRAVSNPEGCSTWQRYEAAAAAATTARRASGGPGQPSKGSSSSSSRTSSSTSSSSSTGSRSTSSTSPGVFTGIRLTEEDKDKLRKLLEGGTGPSCPEMVARWREVYNRNGRIGIYTREEREAILHRFRAKRQRRVWSKKIRYDCRKSLADRRVRVKGRFVKLSVASEQLREEDDEDEDEAATTTGYRPKSKRGAAAVAMAISPPAGDMGQQQQISGSSSQEDEQEEVVQQPPLRRMRRHSIG